MMNSKQTPQIAPDLIWRLLDDDAVLVSPRVGKVRVLNHVGTTIWQLLTEQKGIREIEAYLISQYDISAEQAHSDLQAFLRELVERDLITWAA